MTDMIPRLSLPLRLKLSFAKLNYMNGHFSLSLGSTLPFSRHLFMELYISAYFSHRTGVSFVQSKLFFFHTHCEPHAEKLFEI